MRSPNTKSLGPIQITKTTFLKKKFLFIISLANPHVDGCNFVEAFE